MALNPDKLHFPMNVVNVLCQSAKFIDPDIATPNDPNYVEGLRVFKRPLDITDGTESVGIFPDDYTPDERSLELGFAKSPVEPTVQNYSITIQGLVLDADEQNGIAVHSLLSSEIRNMVFRDPALRAVLPTLNINYGVGKPTETLIKWSVVRQSFMNNEFRGQYAFLSSLQMNIQTVIN